VDFIPSLFFLHSSLFHLELESLFGSLFGFSSVEDVHLSLSIIEFSLKLVELRKFLIELAFVSFSGEPVDLIIKLLKGSLSIIKSILGSGSVLFFLILDLGVPRCLNGIEFSLGSVTNSIQILRSGFENRNILL
jgi:hypothetical protein